MDLKPIQAEPTQTNRDYSGPIRDYLGLRGLAGGLGRQSRLKSMYVYGRPSRSSRPVVVFFILSFVKVCFVGEGRGALAWYYLSLFRRMHVYPSMFFCFYLSFS